MCDPAIIGTRRTLRKITAHALELSIAIVIVGLAAAAAPARASDNESWANEIISIMASREAALSEGRGRSTAVERMATPMVDEDDERPVRRRRFVTTHARGHDRLERGNKVASLGKQIAPSPAPSSAVEQSLHPKLPYAEKRRPLGPMIASLGRDFIIPAPSREPSLTGGGIKWIASAECLASRLRTVLVELAAAFGPLRVNSTCRSRRHNARVGGAKRSFHLTGNAVDFRMSGNIRSALAFLRGNRWVGGLKHYGHGVFHIDNGPRRTW